LKYEAQHRCEKIIMFGNLPKSARVESPRARPGVESLEGRALMSVALDPLGNIVIRGSNQGDTYRVSYERAGNTNYIKVVENLGGFGESPWYFEDWKVTGKVYFKGLDGNDTFVNDTALSTEADGGVGFDTLYGGVGPDVLYGGSEDDKLYGRLGHDTLHGEGGNDVLDGGDDFMADTLYGGPGADWFQQDWFPGWYFTWNMDTPQDFMPGDRYYG
jgi:hypothetical protein